jgi:hypothetical protein
VTCPWPSPDASTARYVGPGVIACLPLILKDTGRNRAGSCWIVSGAGNCSLASGDPSGNRTHNLLIKRYSGLSAVLP